MKNIKAVSLLFTSILLLIILCQSVKLTQTEINSLNQSNALNDSESILIGDYLYDWHNYSFEGEGTEERPFIIKDLNITSEDNTPFLGGYSGNPQYGIRIANTDKYFKIENCFINVYGPAVRLINVSSCIGINKIISSNSDYNRINLEGVSNLAITNNSVGVSGINCSSIYISETTMDSTDGITFKNSHAISITKCQITGCYRGMSITDSNSVIIDNNTISSCTIRGISMRKVSNSIISENVFKENGHESIGELFFGGGIVLAEASHCVIYSNSFIDNYIFEESQCYDSKNNETYWYNEQLKMGNYWNDLKKNVDEYQIAGPSNSKDIYPLRKPHYRDASFTNFTFLQIIVPLTLLTFFIIRRSKNKEL